MLILRAVTVPCAEKVRVEPREEEKTLESLALDL